MEEAILLHKRGREGERERDVTMIIYVDGYSVNVCVCKRFIV